MPVSLVSTGVQFADNSIQTTGVKLIGSSIGTTLFANSPALFSIVAFDSYTTYTLSTSNGTVTRSGSTISYTPSTAGTGSFVVNGRTIGPFFISATPPGQQAFTTAGTYSWVAPAGVESVCVVAVGSGGNGGTGQPSGYGAGGGGGLGWINNYAVTPGNSYTVVVAGPASGAFTSGSDSYFVSTSVVKGGGGAGASGDTGGAGGTFTGTGGGNGGRGGNGTTPITSGGAGGGGGAGGYSGNGGSSPTSYAVPGNNGSGGGGGSGGPPASFGYNPGPVPGGGVGILGQGANGIGGQANSAGYGGSPGGAGSGGSGVTYGGAGYGWTGLSGGGAVRIIWGPGRAFPSTYTGDL